MSNYATNTDLKNATRIDTSNFALKSDFSGLKTEVDKLNFEKLIPVPVDLSKLSNIVKRFWENKGWINSIDPYGWLQWYFRYWLGRRSLEDERQINRWKGIVSRFKGKLIKMIKDVNGRFDDYSILPKIRQILLHWGYELAESDLFVFCSYKNELLLV